jgi:transposase
VLTPTRAVRVFAYAAPVDMRKGFDGLGALVEQQLGRQLLKGDVFLFVGRCRRRAKVLHFDGTGLVLLTRDSSGDASRGPGARRACRRWS